MRGDTRSVVSLIIIIIIIIIIITIISWCSTRENLSAGVCEQHRRSLISAFVIRVLESTISKLATSEFHFFSS